MRSASQSLSCPLSVGSGFGEHPPPPFVPAAFLLFSFSSFSCQFQLNGRRVHHPTHPSFAILSLPLSLSLARSLARSRSRFRSRSLFSPRFRRTTTRRQRESSVSWRSLALSRSLTSIIRFRCNFQKREKGSKNWFETFFHSLRYVQFTSIRKNCLHFKTSHLFREISPRIFG